MCHPCYRVDSNIYSNQWLKNFSISHHHCFSHDLLSLLYLIISKDWLGCIRTERILGSNHIRHPWQFSVQKTALPPTVSASTEKLLLSPSLCLCLRHQNWIGEAFHLQIMGGKSFHLLNFYVSLLLIKTQEQSHRTKHNNPISAHGPKERQNWARKYGADQARTAVRSPKTNFVVDVCITLSADENVREWVDQTSTDARGEGVQWLMESGAWGIQAKSFLLCWSYLSWILSDNKRDVFRSLAGLCLL